ncbi:MAG TPA: glycerophosphodiester phosphodiesterase [Chitinophagaceae bacterium]|nr:glycerophosphodiester phosphodiesterase [Chitinophagaceae bacterium]
MKTFYYFLIFIFIMSCSNVKNLHSSPPTGGDGGGVFDIQGHRGCRGLMPENTIPALMKALDLGVTTLEMDVVITKDKKVVLSHDQWFAQEITTKPDGTYMGEREERKFNIYWMTYEEVKTFDVGMKPHPRFPQQQKMKVVKPLLLDVIDSAEAHSKTAARPLPYYNIETKSNPEFDGVFQPEPDEFVELLMGVIKEKRMKERVIIQSFDFRTLQYLHQHYPAVKTAMLIEDFDKRNLEDQLKALGFTPTIYSPDYSLVNKDLLKKCYHQNIKVIPWTVNDKETIKKLKAMGVDGIISDYPNLFN